jgi:predicted metal-dependent hydrolase
MTAEVVQGKGFQAEIIRTGRRKTAAIKIEEDRVCVLVPNSATTKKVEELVTKKTRWIREKLLLQRNFQAPKRKEYVSGECFTYLGRNYRLRVEPGASGRVGLKHGRLVVHIPPSVRKQDHYIRNALRGWYRECAQAKFQEKVNRYAKIVGVTPSSLGIKTFKSRWGSCSHAGHVLFNWKIIIAPHRIVDYVVVHELCHLIEHNHSPRFWKCVERVFPDYRGCKDWLKENGRTLTL